MFWFFFSFPVSGPLLTSSFLFSLFSNAPSANMVSSLRSISAEPEMETLSFPCSGAENDRYTAVIKDDDSGDVISNSSHANWVTDSVSCWLNNNCIRPFVISQRTDVQLMCPGDGSRKIDQRWRFLVLSLSFLCFILFVIYFNVNYIFWILLKVFLFLLGKISAGCVLVTGRPTAASTTSAVATKKTQI